VPATFATLRVALHWAHVQEAMLRAQTSLPEAARHTLGDLVARYERDVLRHRPAGTARLQGAQLGLLRLGEVTPARLTACRDRLAATRQPATVNRYLAMLSHALA
jgi:hypothetical protein